MAIVFIVVAARAVTPLELLSLLEGFLCGGGGRPVSAGVIAVVVVGANELVGAKGFRIGTIALFVGKAIDGVV